MARKQTRADLIEENESLWETLEGIHDELGELFEGDEEEFEEPELGE